MLFSRIEVSEYARKIGKSERTLWRWIKLGCNPRDPKSLREWQIRNQIRETPIERARKRRRDNEQNVTSRGSTRPHTVLSGNSSERSGNGDLPPAGRKGAAAALERLEHQEEESHRRLQIALISGNLVQIAAAQDFWLKCSETLRRLDLAVETARREAETQVPLKVAQDAQTAAAEWMRIAFMQFLSSEGVALMGIKDYGTWKAYAVERFRGILNLTVHGAERTCSPVPAWALERIKTAWNVED